MKNAKIMLVDVIPKSEIIWLSWLLLEEKKIIITITNVNDNFQDVKVTDHTQNTRGTLSTLLFLKFRAVLSEFFASWTKSAKPLPKPWVKSVDQHFLFFFSFFWGGNDSSSATLKMTLSTYFYKCNSQVGQSSCDSKWYSDT